MSKKKKSLAVKAITEDVGMNDTSTNSNLLENFHRAIQMCLTRK